MLYQKPCSDEIKRFFKYIFVTQEDTISINHNWLNGCNIDICWDHLKENLCYVKKEIADCEGMEGWHAQCQVSLFYHIYPKYSDIANPDKSDA